MRLPRVLLLAALAALLAATSLPAAALTGREGNMENLLLQYINNGRSTVSRGGLVMHAGLRSKAQGHSSYQAGLGSINHDGFSDRINTAAPDPAESNGAPDDGFSSACENVAYYQPGVSVSDEAVAQKFYDLWYASTSGHKECMLDAYSRGYTVAGVGIWEQTGRWYATLEVVRDTSVPSGTAPPPPPPPPPTATWNAVDSTSSGLARVGTWSTVRSTPSFGRSYLRSKVTGARIVMTFSGTGVRFVGLKNTYGGVHRIFVDGALAANVDAYARSTLYQQVLFERTGLAPGTHSIEIEVSGARNPAARYGYAQVDAFQVKP